MEALPVDPEALVTLSSRFSQWDVMNCVLPQTNSPRVLGQLIDMARSVAFERSAKGKAREGSSEPGSPRTGVSDPARIDWSSVGPPNKCHFRSCKETSSGTSPHSQGSWILSLTKFSRNSSNASEHLFWEVPQVPAGAPMLLHGLLG